MRVVAMDLGKKYYMRIQLYMSIFIVQYTFYFVMFALIYVGAIKTKFSDFEPFTLFVVIYDLTLVTLTIIAMLGKGAYFND